MEDDDEVADELGDVQVNHPTMKVMSNSDDTEDAESLDQKADASNTLNINDENTQVNIYGDK